MTRAWALMFGAWICACGGASAGLDLHFVASSQAWSVVVAKVESSPAAVEREGMAWSITAGTPALLLAHDTAGAERWRAEIAADATLLVAGTSLITVERDTISVRDANTGRARFQRSLAGLSLLGAAEEHDTLVVVAVTPSITAVDPQSVVMALHREHGEVQWERHLTAAIGAPVIRANTVLLPWNRQGLTAIDADTGRELARLEPERTSIDWIREDPSVISYGTDRLSDLACTQNTGVCTSQPSPFVQAPSHPALHPSAYRAPSSAGISTQLQMARNAEGHAQLAQDRAYLIFYRYVFAYRADGTLVWVRLLDHDVLRTRATQGGLVLLDTQGQVTWLRALDGHRVSIANIAHPIRSAQLAGAWPDAPSDTPSNAPSLHEGLRAIIVDHDNRLVVARGYAVEQLARDPDPVITKELLAAYEERATPSGLRQVIARALIDRRTGSEHLIDALARHHDFLTGVFPPPLPVVVPALLAMQERRAVPALLDHLHDPATASEDVARIADGLSQLGDAALLSELLPWLRRYRASQAFAGDPATITALANAVRALGGEESVVTLSALADANDTHPILAAAIRDALGNETPAETPVEATSAVEAPSPLLAKKLTQHDINAAFVPHIEKLRLCTFNALADAPLLTQVRIAFVVRPDGSTYGFAIAPATTALAKCLKPIVDAIRLPAFDARPQLATYVVQLRKTAEPTVAAAGAEAVAEWWSWYARGIPSDGVAWWSAYVEKEHDWVPASVGAEADTRVTTPSPGRPGGTPAAPAVEPATSSPPSAPPATPQSPATPDAWWLPAQP